VRFLLDTNVLSEVRRPEPDRCVLEWLAGLDEDRAFISVISLGEIRRGIGLLEEGRKREALVNWLSHDLPQRFAGRILPIDEAVAFAWGDLMGSARQSGIGLAAMDGLIAATAIAMDLTLATRTTKDFQALGLRLIDPWVD
jgi:predicted nucleic acid-binding protein